MLKMGHTDDPRHCMVKLFCPKCQDVYSCAPNQRRTYARVSCRSPVILLLHFLLMLIVAQLETDSFLTWRAIFQCSFDGKYKCIMLNYEDIIPLCHRSTSTPASANSFSLLFFSSLLHLHLFLHLIYLHIFLLTSPLLPTLNTIKHIASQTSMVPSSVPPSQIYFLWRTRKLFQSPWQNRWGRHSMHAWHPHSPTLPPSFA